MDETHTPSQKEQRRAEYIRRVLSDESFHQNRYARTLDRLVRRGTRWLDIGAGTRVHGGWLGPTPADLATRAVSLVGCDMEIDHLRANDMLSAAVGSDACNLPFADASFDVITANMVVEHLQDPTSVFKEIRRVLAPRGVFIFVTPNRGDPVVAAASILLSRPVRRWLARHIEHRIWEDIFPTYYRANSAASIERHARAAGLRVQELSLFSSFPYSRWPMLLVRLECLWIRLVQLEGLRAFRSNLVCCLARPAD